MFLAMCNHLDQLRVHKARQSRRLVMKQLAWYSIWTLGFAAWHTSHGELEVCESWQGMHVQTDFSSSELTQLFNPLIAQSVIWHALSPLHVLEKSDPHCHCITWKLADFSLFISNDWQHLLFVLLGVRRSNEAFQLTEHFRCWCVNLELINCLPQGSLLALCDFLLEMLQ
jgi:hypothetical protein